MLKLARYLKRYKLYVIMAPLLMVIEVLAELTLPKLMSNIVNIGIANSNMAYVQKTGLLMLLLALVGITAGLGCLYFASKASQNFGTDVREDLFVKIQQFSFANIDKFKTSSLITRLTNDITQIQTIVLMSLRMLVRAPLLLVGGMFMAFSINARVSLIFVAIVPIMAIVVGLLVKFSFPLFGVVQSKLDRVNTVMRENLSGVRVVKVFVREEFEKGKFREANMDYKNTTLRAFRTILLIMPIMMIVMNFATVGILFYGGRSVIYGTMQLGDITALITYLTMIFMSLMMVSMVFMIFSRAKVSIDRVNEVFETDVDIHSPQTPVHIGNIKGNLQFKNVAFKYSAGEGEPVLENINFSINGGQTVAILGETGSGKSTLVNLIPRLYDVTSGEILLDGVNIKDMDLTELRDKVSVVLQEAILFSGSIRENLKWGKADATEEEMIEAARNACALEFIEELPEGLDTEIDQKGVNFSGGQKQRLSIARALIKKPAILILDDSTSAVDMITEKKLQNALATKLKDTTKIIIAQRISSVINADKILVLGNGTIIAEGSHDELMKTSPDYKAIYDSQLKKGVTSYE